MARIEDYKFDDIVLGGSGWPNINKTYCMWDKKDKRIFALNNWNLNLSLMILRAYILLYSGYFWRIFAYEFKEMDFQKLGGCCQNYTC